MHNCSHIVCIIEYALCTVTCVERAVSHSVSCLRLCIVEHLGRPSPGLYRDTKSLSRHEAKCSLSLQRILCHDRTHLSSMLVRTRRATLSQHNFYVAMQGLPTLTTSWRDTVHDRSTIPKRLYHDRENLCHDSSHPVLTPSPVVPQKFCLDTRPRVSIARARYVVVYMFPQCVQACREYPSWIVRLASEPCHDTGLEEPCRNKLPLLQKRTQNGQ